MRGRHGRLEEPAERIGARRYDRTEWRSRRRLKSKCRKRRWRARRACPGLTISTTSAVQQAQKRPLARKDNFPNCPARGEPRRIAAFAPAAQQCARQSKEATRHDQPSPKAHTDISASSERAEGASRPRARSTVSRRKKGGCATAGREAATRRNRTAHEPSCCSRKSHVGCSAGYPRPTRSIPGSSCAGNDRRPSNEVRHKRGKVCRAGQ